MEENKFQDVLGNILMETLSNRADELQKEGKSISDISKILNDDKISSIVEKLLERASSDNVSFYKSHLHEIIEDADIEKNRFLQHHHSIWGECFEASRVMYIIAVEGAEAFCHYVTDNIPIDTRESKQFTFLALQHIHGRVCQQFAEVLCLMENGFADGAYARWRSMFELCCTATFISEQGEQIAKQYIEASKSDKQKYEWTKGAKDPSGKEITIKTFAALQSQCHVNEKWKPQYKLACSIIHPTPQGTMGRLSNADNSNCVPVGQSNFGISIPAEHSAISLARATNIFLTVFTYMDGLSTCETLNKWIDVIRESYFSAMDNFKKEEGVKDDHP